MTNVVRAFCNLRREPSFAALVILTIALGIGATTAMFSVVDAILINPLPFPHADRVIEVWINFDEGAPRLPATMNQVVAAVQNERDLFDAVGRYDFESGTLTGSGEPETLSLMSMSPSTFALLPTAPLAGRLFVESDAFSGERVLLISERFWASRFGRDPSVVGRLVTIDDQPNRIIGVLPAQFVFPDSDRDGWRPIDIDASKETRLQMVALRKAAVSRQLIDDRLKALTRSLRESGALPPGQVLVTQDPRQFSGARRGANGLYLLLAAAVVLLLVACVNVTSLFLVRGSGRRAELAVRAAMGAGRFALMRDAAIESLLLAAGGCAAGLWIAKGLLDALLVLAPGQIRSAARYTGSLDPRAVLFAIAVTLATCLIWSVLPAWRASRVDAIDALRSARSTIARREGWWQGALVSTQVALVVILLAGAGLLLRSFIKLNQVDLGFNPDRLVVMELRLTQPRYATPGAALDFMRELEARVETELGVPVTIGSTPVRAGGYSDDERPEAEGFTPPTDVIYLPYSRVSPDFFDVYQIPILEGRPLTAADGDEAIILNDVMARRYFGDVSPIGRRFRLHTSQPWLIVVGVARDVKTMGPSDPLGHGMEVYVGYSRTRRPYNFLSLSAAFETDPDAGLARIKKIVWELDPRMPTVSARSMRDQVSNAIAQPRFVLSLSGAFTICAIVIAAIGVYGVSAYWVARRRRELAIRLAIGASPQMVARSVIGRSIKLATLGGAIGLTIALAGASLIESMLFGTDPRDPLTFGLVTLLLAIVAVIACAMPAVKAARVDPMQALRAE